jgi:alkanesulfonate monooxygenase SsuD/methylene tetrahydromethanopterin reductase-like flavin-dependent oxidoreductase (luciferase family)
MEFYYFGGNFHGPQISNLEKSHFSGVMFTYDATQGDMLVRMARHINPNEKIKYLIAIRPYSVSPQYLCMVNDSINEIDSGRFQVNLISGYVKDHEADFGGIIGSVNDSSDRITRSKYLIKYVKTLNTMLGNLRSQNKLDFYISTTNNFVFETAKIYNNKIILPYRDYLNSYWTVIGENGGQALADNPMDLSDVKIMLALTPIIRETQEELEALTDYAIRPVWRKGEKPAQVTDVGYFTYEQFDEFVKELEAKGINQLLINGWPEAERDKIIKFIKYYSELKGNKETNPSLENNLGE